jgi:hypothetical protein
MIRVTRAIALAAGHDAGNRSMKRAGRVKWDETDWNAAADTFAALYPSEDIHLFGESDSRRAIVRARQ